MSGVLHADLLAHLRTPGAEIHWVFELDLPSGDTVLLSLDGVTSKSLGPYRPWLRSIGDLSRRLSDWRGGLEAPTVSVEINDTGGQFTLAYGRRLRGYVARLKLLGPYALSTATHFTWFTGVVDSVSKAGNVITVGLRFTDDRLAAKVPKAAIAPYMFTSLPGETDLRGQAIPYLVGDHDSTGLDALGMVRCSYVGSPAAGQYQYLVCNGWWATVVRVFSAGVEKAAPGDYEVVQALTGDSRRVTLLQFTADQGDSEVLADLQDLDSATGPAAVLQQLVADLAFGDEHGEHLDPTLAPVYVASVTAFDTFVRDGLGLGRSYALPGDRRVVLDVLREFAQSYDAQLYWRYDGTLAVIPWELRRQNDTAFLGAGAPDVTLAALRVLSADLYTSEPSFATDPEATITRVAGKSGRRASDGSWLNSRSVVVDPAADMERSREVEMPWLPATAESVGELEYMTASASSSVTGWSAVGAASIEAAVSQGPPPAGADNAIRAQSDTATTVGAGTAEFDIDLTDVPEIVAGQSLTLWLTSRAVNSDPGDEDELDAAIVLAGSPATAYWGTVLVGVGPTQRRDALAVWPTDPSTSLPWTRAALNGAKIRVRWNPGVGAGAINGGKRIHVHQAYCAFSYTAAANVSPASLAILSRLANRYREAPEVLTVSAPLWALDYDLGDDVPLEDSREGWGGQPWSRGQGRIVGMRVGPGVGGVELQLEDIRGQLTTFWLQGRALAGVDGASAAGDGMALLTPGCTVTVDRASPKYLDSPAGIDVQQAGPVVKILNNCWPSERRGTLLERERTNDLKYSSFADLSAGAGSMPTGWTATSGTCESDATVGEQLFVDPSVSANVLLLTQSASDARATGTVTKSYSANTKVTVSIDRKSSSATTGDGGAWRLTRAVDGKYWNESGNAWQVGAVDNTLTPTTSWDRFKSNPIDVGSGATTLTLQLVHLATATASSVVRFGHAQIEEGQWPSSRIVTGATAVTRAADAVTIDNDKDDGDTFAHLLPNDRGWVRWHLRARWAAGSGRRAVTAGTTFTVFTLRYDTDNAWSLAYVANTGWRLRARSGGVDVDAVVDVDVEVGVEYEVAHRWTSSLAEWGKSETMTLQVKRVSTGVILGSTEVAYTPPVYGDGALFGLGHDTDTAGLQFDGYVIQARESPLPPSDADLEAAAFDLAEEE